MPKRMKTLFTINDNRDKIQLQSTITEVFIMSLKDGIAALKPEMTDRVPRTECSAERHWNLINAVVKTNVSAHSPAEVQN